MPHEPARQVTELLAALAAGSAVAAVGKGLDGGDVQQGHEGAAVRVGLGDEDFRFHQGHEVGVADGVGFAAGGDDAKRLERLAVEHVADGLGGHTGSVPMPSSGEQARPPDGRTVTAADLPEPRREHYEHRAAVREYEGGQAREHAEAEAWQKP